MTAGEVKWRHVFGDKGSRRGRGEQKRERDCEGNTVAKLSPYVLLDIRFLSHAI